MAETITDSGNFLCTIAITSSLVRGLCLCLATEAFGAMNTSSSVEIRTEVRFAMMILLVCRSRPKCQSVLVTELPNVRYCVLRYLAKVLACHGCAIARIGGCKPRADSGNPHRNLHREVDAISDVLTGTPMPKQIGRSGVDDSRKHVALRIDDLDRAENRPLRDDVRRERERIRDGEF